MDSEDAPPIVISGSILIALHELIPPKNFFSNIAISLTPCLSMNLINNSRISNRYS